MNWRLTGLAPALLAGTVLMAATAHGQIQSQPLPPPPGASQSPPPAAATTAPPAAKPIPERTPTPLPVPRTGQTAGPRNVCPEQKVDINAASAETLRTLPQISAERSTAIVKARPYARPDDLVKKKVLKKAVYDKIRPCITASATASPPAATATRRAATSPTAAPVPLPTPAPGGSEPARR